VFNLVVSNVPGPQQTFYLDGVPLLEVYPAVPLNPREDDEPVAFYISIGQSF